MHHEANGVVGCDAGAPAGATVSLRDVRESYFECLGFWPTNAAPAGMEGGRLDKCQFREFCYLAEKPENQQSGAALFGQYFS